MSNHILGGLIYIDFHVLSSQQPTQTLPSTSPFVGGAARARRAGDLDDVLEPRPALTRINVAFGTALTDRATIPARAVRNMQDPYADKERPWKLYIILIVVVALAAGWYFGKLDAYLPDTVKSTAVLPK